MDYDIFSFKMSLKKILVTFLLLFGGGDNLLKTLLTLMCVDLITGLLKSILGKSEKSKNGYLSSDIMWHGGLKKIMTLSIIVVASTVNSIMIPETELLRTMTITYYIAIEALSIIENALHCGLPIPKKIIDVLETLKNKN